ncbi:hypothetical protein [uncultured Dokdonia sp.]|uniref:hypothetical protein n=1 Tax=uncultured Dokdonia sp. TaxID=575653 RepID=UPI00261F340E|nr:hypothetical protein [uncultured Dokdonia sp.]
MKESIINRNVEYGVFKKYYDGYFQFVMDNGDTIVFESISSLALKRFDLKSNKFIGRSFEISYSEYIEDDDEDFVLYKIEKLELA